MRILEVGTSGTIGTVEMGPVSTVICELSNRFVARGHEVTVVDARNEAARPFLHPGIRVVELSVPPSGPVGASTLSRVGAIVQNWAHCYRLARQLTSHIHISRTDVVHLHSPELAYLIQRLHAMRGYYTAHTPVWSLPEHVPDIARGQRASGAGKLYASLTAWVEREVVRRASLTIGLGNYLAAAMPGAKIVSIPNGIDFDAWRPMDRDSARHALGINPDDFTVLFTGRIAYIKGIDVLLEAVRALAKDIANLKVIIIGSLSGSFDSRDAYVDPYARAMTESSRGLPVSFLGFINNRELRFRQYFAAADLFVAPSRREPQGLVVLESLAMGTPVAVSDTGGMPDMVAPEVGYLFPPEDFAALAACIRHAHDHRQQLLQMRLAARSHVQKNYSWDQVADRYLAAFADSTADSSIPDSPPQPGSSGLRADVLR